MIIPQMIRMLPVVSLCAVYFLAMAEDGICTGVTDCPSKGLAMLQVGQSPRSPTAMSKSAFHDAVGEDGAVMMTLRGRGGYEYGVDKFRSVGINMLSIEAVDGRTATPADVAAGCVTQDLVPIGNCQADQGCRTMVEAALTESHRRALEYALHREGSNWTAIFEDDAIPVEFPGVDWDLEFRRAWEHLPPTARIIRLHWSDNFGAVRELPKPIENKGRFQWLQHANSSHRDGFGGCLTAYMVHKEFIPEMLKVFPCCMISDACYIWEIYVPHWKVLFNLVAVGSDGYEHGPSEGWSIDYGVMTPARKTLPSTHAGV